MAASTAGALKAFIEGLGLSVSVFRDQAPAGKALPYVTVQESIAFVADPTSAPFDHSADPPWFRETAQVSVWQTWQQKSGTSRTLIENPALAESVLKGLQGSALPAIGTSKVWGVLVRNMIRIVDIDTNTVANHITVEIMRDA